MSHSPFDPSSRSFSQWWKAVREIPGVRLEYKPYRLPCRRPLPVPQGGLYVREGLLIRIASGDGRSGWGDIAPLPGLHREDFSTVASIVRRIAKILEEPETFSRGLPMYNDLLPPSVNYGLESALEDWMLAGNPEAPWRCGKVRVNALFTPGSELKSASDKIRGGYDTLKVKVGRHPGSRAEEVNALKELRSVIGEAVKIRLDANRAWTLEEAVEFGRDVRGLNIEYIEEPLRDPAELEVFFRQTGLRFAWDETLLEREHNPILYDSFPEGLAAVILKPALLGGLEALQSWIRAADARNIDWVVTSCFESGVGLRNLARTSWLNGAGGRAMGLATADYFERDVLDPALAMEKGAIDLGEGFSSEILIT